MKMKLLVQFLCEAMKPSVWIIEHFEEEYQGSELGVLERTLQTMGEQVFQASAWTNYEDQILTSTVAQPTSQWYMYPAGLPLPLDH